MQITNQKVEELHAAIGRIPALLKAPKGTMAIAKNKRLINVLKEDLTAAIQAAWKEHFGDDKTVAGNDPRLPAFEVEKGELLKVEVDFEAVLMTLAELNYEVNSERISPDDLAILSVLISDF